MKTLFDNDMVSTLYTYRRIVLRRQCSDTNRNTDRSLFNNSIFPAFGLENNY